MKTLKQYLFELQNQGYDLSDLEAVKAEYRKKYQKVMRQQYQKTKKRKELTFSLDQYHILESASKAASMKVGEFAIQCIMKSLGTNTVVVREDAHTRDIVSATHRCSNLLNQWVRIANKTQSIQEKHIKNCQSLLKQLDAEVRRILLTPIDLEKQVKKALSENPNRVHRFARIIIQHLSTT